MNILKLKPTDILGWLLFGRIRCEKCGQLFTPVSINITDHTCPWCAALQLDRAMREVQKSSVKPTRNPLVNN